MDIVEPVQAIARGELAALRQCRLFVCDDIIEARDQIAKVLQPHRLLPLRMVDSHPHHMDVIDIPGVRVSAVSFGEARIEVPPLADYHAVIFCLSGQARVRAGGQEVDIGPRRAVTCGPGHPLEGHFSSDCEQLVLRIDRAAMQAHTGLRHVVLNPVIDLSGPSTRPWLVHLRNLTDDPELLRMVRNDRRNATNFTSLLLGLLVNGHLHGDAPEPSRQRAVPASVYRAEAFIEAHAADPITLEAIAAAAHTPVRTLLDGFRRFREISPMQHLRNVRLNQARDRIMGSRSQSIAAIALECGFGNLGRFAQQYAERFGERPSETRAMSKRLI
jgi:AraC-like DNA-binding protein